MFQYVQGKSFVAHSVKQEQIKVGFPVPVLKQQYS